HVPPKDTSIDECAAIDVEFRPRASASGVLTTHVGSSAVRDFILASRPLLCLCGHVHEAKGSAMLGETLCINPGSQFERGIMQGVLVEISPEKGCVTGWRFVEA